MVLNRRQPGQDIGGWFEKKRARRNALIKRSVLVLAAAAAVSLGVVALTKKDQITSSKNRFFYVANLSDTERADLFRNPVLRSESQDEIREQILAAYTSERFFESSPPPTSLEDLQEQIDNMGDNIVVLGTNELPPEFWENFSEEETKLIRKYVKCFAFQAGLFPFDKTARAWYAGEGLIVFDTEQVQITGAHTDVFRGVTLHEAKHSENDAKSENLTHLLDEKSAFEVELEFLERVPRTEEVAEETEIVQEALRVAEFLLENYSHVPEFQNLHPGKGIRAIHLFNAGVSPDSIIHFPKNGDSDLFEQMRIAIGSLRYVGLQKESLQQITDDYVGEYYRTGDYFYLAVADQLSELLVEFFPDDFPDTGIDRMDPFGFVTALNTKVGYDPTFKPAPLEPEENDLENVLNNFAEVDADILEKRVFSSLQKEALTVPEAKRLSSRLYVLAYYYLDSRDYGASAYFLQLYFQDFLGNVHVDGESSVVYSKLMTLCYSQRLISDVDYRSEAERQSLQRHCDDYTERGLQLLGEEGFDQVVDAMHSEDDNDGFSYTPRYTPEQLEFSWESLFVE